MWLSFSFGHKHDISYTNEYVPSKWPLWDIKTFSDMDAALKYLWASTWTSLLVKKMGLVPFIADTIFYNENGYNARNVKW